jgi:hypothetical protein
MKRWPDEIKRSFEPGDDEDEGGEDTGATEEGPVTAGGAAEAVEETAVR